MLLALLAEAKPEFTHVVDIGCGTGTLGVSLAAAAGTPLSLCDRDELAVQVACHNAGANKVEIRSAATTIRGASGIPAPLQTDRELIVSNLPAKAGEQVLGYLVQGALRRASVSNGALGLVLVKPLEGLGDRLLSDAELVARRSNANHVAYLVRPVQESASEGSRIPERDEVPREYVRTSARFMGPRREYEAATAFNIPEFDGLSFRTALAFDLMREERLGAPVLLYGTGQGHLAIGASQIITGTADSGRARITIADRDALALAIAERNLRANGEPAVNRQLRPWVPVASAAVQVAGLKTLIINDDPVPESDWNERVSQSVGLLSPGGRLLLVSRSTSLSRFEKSSRGRLRVVADRRMHGFRAALFSVKR